MNARQIQLVQDSFALAAPQADKVAALFYQRLFTLDPSLQSLFRGDMHDQGKKLIAMLLLVVSNLDKPERIVPVARLLGQRHVDYGVQPQHYRTVGEALLMTLAQGLGDAFTPDVEAAWVAAYEMLAAVMQEGAASATATQTAQAVPVH